MFLRFGGIRHWVESTVESFRGLLGLEGVFCVVRTCWNRGLRGVQSRLQDEAFEILMVWGRRI